MNFVSVPRCVGVRIYLRALARVACACEWDGESKQQKHKYVLGSCYCCHLMTRKALPSEAEAHAGCGGLSNGRIRFANNTCIFLGNGTAYEFSGCRADRADAGPYLNSSVWATSGNTFILPSGSTLHVRCASHSIVFTEWQVALHQDKDSKMLPGISLEEIIANASALLKILDT
eukprot:6187593-Pleurochrysis_carterae.AAC.2